MVNKNWRTLTWVLIIAYAVVILAAANANLSIRKVRYTDGAFEAVKYRQATGHDASWAWIVTAASYSRPSGQSDEDWIRITDARAAAWEAEHVGKVTSEERK